MLYGKSSVKTMCSYCVVIKFENMKLYSTLLSILLRCMISYKSRFLVTLMTKNRYLIPLDKRIYVKQIVLLKLWGYVDSVKIGNGPPKMHIINSLFPFVIHVVKTLKSYRLWENIELFVVNGSIRFLVKLKPETINTINHVLNIRNSCVYVGI